MDNLTKQQRTKNMSAIKSKNNKSTEEKFLLFLKQNKITGWRRHPKKYYGAPDFIFQSLKIAVFLDGCFWHKCKIHFKSPKSNLDYWITKIKRNVKRDKEVNSYYKKLGWKVVRIWEHSIKKNKLHRYIKLLQR
ncbi:MAG: very short patch repair endonuclease [Candidatus Micrarchaeia archaeon]